MYTASKLTYRGKPVRGVLMTGFSELSTGATFYLAQHFFTTLPEEA